MARRRWLRPMVARDRDEQHRASSPLELFFDLCFAVAVSQAAGELRRELVLGRWEHALFAYFLVFFAIWWAWMNFTWFASAYDTDDVPYRWKVFVLISGVLTLAAGVPRAFEQRDFGIVTVGYVVMRAGVVAQWLRASRRADSPHRLTALRYALGVTLVQAGWIAAYWLPARLWSVGWSVLLPAELLVPVWAERAGPTPWHPRHIVDRHGSFTLIVLGEGLLSSTAAIQTEFDERRVTPVLGSIVIGGLLLVFSMWWLYFDRPVDRQLMTGNRFAFFWGYGHLGISRRSRRSAPGSTSASNAPRATRRCRRCWPAGPSPIRSRCFSRSYGSSWSVPDIPGRFRRWSSEGRSLSCSRRR